MRYQPVRGHPQTLQHLTAILRSKLRAGPAEGLRAFLDLWQGILTGSDYRIGCSDLAVCIDESTGDTTPAARAAASGVFTTWRSLLTETLHQHGADPRHAEQLATLIAATLIVAALEGAVAMSRAERDTHPLDDVTAQLEPLLRAATGGESQPSRP